MLLVLARLTASDTACRYDGVLYRGINKDLNPIMKTKYDTYETAFAVGTKLTFPAPTACSTSDVVAGDFTNGIQLVIQKAGGVSLLPGQLSAYDESEVMLPFPSSFKVIARSKVQDTVVVVIEAIDTAFSYCSPALEAPAADVSAGSAITSPIPAIASGGSAAISSPDQAEDPDVLALSQSLKTLGVGIAAVCLGFAKKLAEEGVLTMDRLKKLPEADAREVLEAAGMKKLQVRTVMEAIAPPPVVVPISPAPSPAPAPKPAPHVPAVSSPPAPSAESLFQEGQRLYEQQRHSDAAKSWGQAALLQHGASHAFLSSMLIEGRPDVPKDEKRAFELAAAGAAMGCAHSKGALGRCLVYGFGVAKDVGKGLALGRESAAAGSCFGQFVVGRCYEEGVGVAQDYAEAVRLYRLAAAQGLAAAQHNLGLVFHLGQGVAQDNAEAIRWYRLAAAQGNARATAELQQLGA